MAGLSRTLPEQPMGLRLFYCLPCLRLRGAGSPGSCGMC